MKLKIYDVEHTGHGCPTVYDFKIEDSKKYKDGYLHYRWGALRIVLYNHDHEMAFREVVDYGDEYDGIIDFEEAVQILKNELNIKLRQ